MNASARSPAAAPTRREILVGSLAFGSLLLAPRLLRADPRPSAPSGRRAIVLLHLRGGNDGLNTVVPLRDEHYRRLRPALALDPASCHRLSDDVGLHPALGDLAALWEDERLAIVNGVGYPDPPLSHFRATEIWHTARPDRTAGDGWLGRAFTAPREGSTPSATHGVRAVAFDRQAPQSFSGAGSNTLTLRTFGDLRLPARIRDVDVLYRAWSSQPGVRGQVGRAGHAAWETARSIAALKPAKEGFSGRLGADLAQALSLLDARLGVDVLQLAFDGFDTHANQAEAHARLLGELGTNLRAFQRGVEARGLGREVVCVVFSEFGRRPEENLSAGTDHGTAGPVFVLGEQVRAGLHGAQPSLDPHHLVNENLRFTTDFRRIYAALLEGPLALDPHPLIGSHEPLDLWS